MRDYGAFLKGEREHLGLRQIDLADGICSKDTIYKIEKGSQIPSATVFSMCMERLGVSGFSYGDFFDCYSIHVFELKEEIKNCLIEGDVENVVDYMAELKELLEDGTIWDCQFFQLAWARYMELQNLDNHRQVTDLKLAAMMSLTDLEGRREFAGRPLNKIEIALLSEIAVREFKRDELLLAITLFNRIIIHVEKYTSDSTIRDEMSAMLYSNAAMAEKDKYKDMALIHMKKALKIAQRKCNIHDMLKIMRNSCFFGEKIRGINEKDLAKMYSSYNAMLKIDKTYERFKTEDVFFRMI